MGFLTSNIFYFLNFFLRWTTQNASTRENKGTIQYALVNPGYSSLLCVYMNFRIFFPNDIKNILEFH